MGEAMTMFIAAGLLLLSGALIFAQSGANFGSPALGKILMVSAPILLLAWCLS
jgi:hypothetical protein